ncbi:Detected protein of confused Function [Hibiscus syriacus]|uniref:Detected protein of confused Function n=1 Tax=Hibiscus syriacus TaxID=106335 RepID=A0A6A2Y918_HIBSY|nr:Detected protein of confused Function [Hibiscus syriacus]
MEQLLLMGLLVLLEPTITSSVLHSIGGLLISVIITSVHGTMHLTCLILCLPKLSKSPCYPFVKTKHGLFGFSKGCLQMNRWDELNRFFNAIRQTLIGGNYGPLNATTYVPSPDYYRQDASPFLQSYAHCSKGRAEVTLLVINLSSTTTFVIDVRSSINNIKLATEKHNTGRKSISSSLKNAVSRVGIEASSDEDLYREEYHLNTGNIPGLDPVRVNSKFPISIAPLSIAFIVFPDFVAPACG